MILVLEQDKSIGKSKRKSMTFWRVGEGIILVLEQNKSLRKSGRS